MKHLSIFFILLFFFQSTVQSAEDVKSIISEDKSYKNYIDNHERLTAKINSLEQAVRNNNEAIRAKNASWATGTNFLLALPFVRPIVELLLPLRALLNTFFALSLVAMLGFLMYLRKGNPLKFRLMTSLKTLSVLKSKIKSQHLLALCLTTGLALVAVPTSAATNSLQDIYMKYFGNDFEKGYIACKYSKTQAKLGYNVVNGYSVFQNPSNDFEVNYDVATHLIALNKPLGETDLLDVIEASRSDDNLTLAFKLISVVSLEVARNTYIKIQSTFFDNPRITLKRCIALNELMISSLDSKNASVLSQAILDNFFANISPRVQYLEDVLDLVEYAEKYESIAIIKDRVVKMLAGLPQRLNFNNTIYAAQIQTRINKDAARTLFNAVRYEFKEYLKNADMMNRIVALLTSLNSVPEFRPLYDKDALTKGLRDLNNTQRLQMTMLFDRVSTELASHAQKTIDIDHKSLVFSNDGLLQDCIAITKKYNQPQITELFTNLVKALAEIRTPYTMVGIRACLEEGGQNFNAFIEDFMVYDARNNYRSGQNDSLVLNLFSELPRNKLEEHTDYFKAKAVNMFEVVDILNRSQASNFYPVLGELFRADPLGISKKRLSNTIVNTSSLRKGFNSKSVDDLKTIPATFFVAYYELVSNTPDSSLAQKAVVSILRPMFLEVLAGDKKALSESSVLRAVLMREILANDKTDIFKAEKAILSKLLEEYFTGRTDNANTLLAQDITKLEGVIAKQEAQISALASLSTQIAIINAYGVIIIIFLTLGFVLSVNFALNSLLPGNDFTFFHGLLNFMDSFGKFKVATIVLLLPGLGSVLLAQLFRGLTAKRTAIPSLKECVEFHEAQLIGANKDK